MRLQGRGRIVGNCQPEPGMMAMGKFKVFKRSARNFEEFARARKTTIRTGLTRDEARRMCEEFNGNRTPAQERAGTKYEFTSQ